MSGQYGREGEGGRDIAAHTANREREHGGGRERGGGTSLFLLPCGPAETARPQSVRGWGREARVYSRDMGWGNSREGGGCKVAHRTHRHQLVREVGRGVSG